MSAETNIHKARSVVFISLVFLQVMWGCHPRDAIAILGERDGWIKLAPSELRRVLRRPRASSGHVEVEELRQFQIGAHSSRRMDMVEQGW